MLRPGKIDEILSDSRRARGPARPSESALPAKMTYPQFPRGQVLPTNTKPGKRKCESDGRLVANGRAGHVNDRAPHDRSLYNRRTVAGFHKQVHDGAWQQPLGGFDQCAPRGSIDDRRTVPGPDAGGYDSMVDTPIEALRFAPLRRSQPHCCFHWPARAS